jgi:hypothetical protein
VSQQTTQPYITGKEDSSGKRVDNDQIDQEVEVQIKRIPFVTSTAPARVFRRNNNAGMADQERNLSDAINEPKNTVYPRVLKSKKSAAREDNKGAKGNQPSKTQKQTAGPQIEHENDEDEEQNIPPAHSSSSVRARRSLAANVKVTVGLSCVSPTTEDVIVSTSRRFGFAIESGHQFSHLIMERNSRTIKFLFAIAMVSSYNLQHYFTRVFDSHIHAYRGSG